MEPWQVRRKHIQSNCAKLARQPMRLLLIVPHTQQLTLKNLAKTPAAQ